MNAALDAGVTFAGDEHGGFIHPPLHPGFDAMFGFARLVTVLRKTGLKLSEVIDEMPPFPMAYAQVRCPWDVKGTVMRSITEGSRDSERVETLDGIKIYDRDQWVLVLPDAVEPVFHVYAESPEQAASEAIVLDYVKRIERLQAGT
jgi:mannose-1-phosphate guanylyltransferase/phosphomannomutase